MLAALQAPLAVDAAIAGPGAWSANQTWAADANHGGNLTGYVYWPATQPNHPTGKRALVLVLHGCAQTAAGDVINNGDNGYNWKRTADHYGAIVVAPNATGNVSNAHCWNYYGATHTRSSGHNGVLLDLVNRIKNDPAYAIDPDQVYVTGLSSGGGQAMVLGCLAPDVFAGIGNNAGPALGTTASQGGAVPYGFTATTAANHCRTLAGSQADKFATQIANAVWGQYDYTVSQNYGRLNMQAMRQVYGGSYASYSGPLDGGSIVYYEDSNQKMRTSEIVVAGMGHAWPGGPGAQNANYVKDTILDYPNFIMTFWNSSNLRASRINVNSLPSTTTTTTIGGTNTLYTTTTTLPPTCFTASNAGHVAAGRAYNSYGYAKANGSNQNMGLNNTYTIRTLKQTGSNYYVIGTCN